MIFIRSTARGASSRPVAGIASRRARMAGGGRTFVAGMAMAVGAFAGFAGSANAVDLAPAPLYAGSRVPGNLALVPSVEFPTVVSAANLQTTYTAAGNFVGYFDPQKCYAYSYSAIEANRHFYPVSIAPSKTCADPYWSGNFLNWAATQTIDPFRSALTGGYRVRDTPTETWVEKAVGLQGGTNNFEHRGVNNTVEAGNATPAQWGSIRMRILGQGNKMRFGANQTNVENGNFVVSYDPATHDLDDEWVSVPQPFPLPPLPVRGNAVTYEVSVRVKVCDPAVGVETNCKLYPSGSYKPEGLIQEYSDRITYSAFSYQNVDGDSQDGGVLRANQKFVGPLSYYPEAGPQPNANMEWDPSTGVQFVNPNPVDATTTAAAVAAGGGTCGVVDPSVPNPCLIRNSGVINYINKFGQMSTGKNVKSQDNVSELYYTATRYFKRLATVPEYNQLTGNQTNRYRRADGFPIVTDWQDPVRYRCQTNVILGIGDTNTWQDKNLPSATPTGTANEPTKPALVRDDTTVDVIEDMTRIWRMEMGWDDATARARARRDWFNGEGQRNSGYMAALAYDANTRDIRPQDRPNPLPGRQTITTHWVDVIEGRGDNDYKTTQTNQYYLATKYGGFTVPGGYDPDTNTTALTNSWWTDGDSTPRFTRPRNFYAAANAARMVASLRLAFENIIQEIAGSGGAFASNSTVLESGARVYQSQFAVNSGSWSGDMQAYNINPSNGALTEAWRASSSLPVWNLRNIWINSGSYQRFNTQSLLNAAHQGQITSQTVMDYMRGQRVNEQPTGTLRRRFGVIGDIVNSEPVYVGAPNPNLYLGRTFSGASTYQAFVASEATRRKMVYVGANDGMLHGFDADTGEERYAFIPSAAANVIGNYSRPDFEHRYFVDGEIAVADVFNTTTLSWQTVLVGTMGRGGRGLYALDVTDPDAITFLWEHSSTDIPALGNALGKPVIAQVASGSWQVLVGNGPNGNGARAQLVRINVLTGAVQPTIDTGIGSDNGLSGVNIWSSIPNGFADTAYGGDFRGNLWRIDLTTGVSSRMFRTEGNRPITATPLIARRPASNEVWAFFGTGSYLNEADLANLSEQRWYGIIDRGATPVTHAGLQEVEIVAEGEIAGMQVRAIEQMSPVSVGDGWYIRLVSPVRGAEGERMVVPNQFRGRALIGTTRIPDSTDVCSPTGRGYIMAIDPFTGGHFGDGSFFDVDGDGSFTETIGSPPVPVSGIGLPSGPNSPTFLGNTMFWNLDNQEEGNMDTNPAGTGPERVSWREWMRN